MTNVYLDKSRGWATNTPKQTPGNRTSWGNLEMVDSLDDADYQVAMTTVARNPDTVKTLLFAREPPCLSPESRWEGVNVFEKYPLSRTHMPQVWRFDKTYDELKHLEPVEKLKDLSWVISNKGQPSNPPWFRFLRWYREVLIRRGYRKYQYKYLPFTKRLIERGDTLSELAHQLNNGLLNYPTDGHIMRMKFLDSLTAQYPELLDVYGWGTWDESQPYYKGVLDDKWQGLEEYRYSLAISNYHGPNYFGKITAPLLAWCMPIHWGCTNLSEYFPEDSYVRIDIEDENAPEKVKEVVESDLRERNLDAIAEARERILDKYQFWPTLEREIEKLEAK